MLVLLFGLEKAFTAATIWIVTAIYHVAAFVFELFLILASGQLLDQNSYDTIIENFYIVLGIIMLFGLAFAMLKSMVNPDEQKKGTETVKKTIINLVTSAIIMAILPSVFSFAYDFQDAVILEQNTIGKFFGYGSQSASGNNSPAASNNLIKVKQGAYQIVNGVFTAFFNINSESCYSLLELDKDAIENEYDVEFDDLTNKDKLDICQDKIEAEDEKTLNGITDKFSFINTSGYVDNSGGFGAYSAFAGNVVDEALDFNFMLSLIGGILLIYIGVSYCFDMAVRLVKLVFYQLIAPIPIFFRIIPNSKLNGTFNEWLKITMTCYLEVYIRIFIFYFVVYLCNEMIKSQFIGTDIYEYGWFIALLAKAFVLMGLITFMKQAPGLFAKITGIDSSNMKLGIRDKLAAGGAFTAGAILGGGATALTRNAVSGVKNAKNKWQEVGKEGLKGREKAKAVGKALHASTLGLAGSVFAGGFSGAVRSGKAGANAKSFGDMKASASSGASGAVKAKEKRATYKANHGNSTLRSIKGHISDTFRGAKEWAGIGVVNAAEASAYDMGANAFDSAHSALEATYKGKPGHDKMKETVSNLKSKFQRIENTAKEKGMWYAGKTLDDLHTEIANREVKVAPLTSGKIDAQIKDLSLQVEPLKSGKLDVEINALKSQEILTNVEQERLAQLEATKVVQSANLEKLKELEAAKVTLEAELKGLEDVKQFAFLKEELQNAQTELTLHEAGEMSKKMSMSLTAINDLVIAKKKHFEMSEEIFTEDIYNILRDSKGKNIKDVDNNISKLVAKIRANEKIELSDLRGEDGKDIIDFNSLEKFLDKIGTDAKNMATKKKIDVKYAKALKDENKGDSN